MDLLVNEVGELRYNGVSFNAHTRTTSVSVRPEYTSDGRTVMLNRWSLSFETMIYGKTRAECDATANRYRKALSKNGGPFVLTARGIGDIRVNVGRVRDVDNGPKPQELSFDAAVGSELASRLRWSISFAIPECDDAVYQFQAMDFGYSVTYSTQNGYTTRSIRGDLRIPQNRVENGERFPQDSVDRYRERIHLDPPEGFRPQGGTTVTLSKDRSTLNFEQTHVEMGRNIYPPGVVEASLSHTVTSTSPLGGAGQGTFTGNYELPKNGQVRDAVDAFNKAVEARVKQAEAAPAVPGFDGKRTKAQYMFPVAFTVTEPDVYGPRKVSISLTYNVIASFQAIMASGIWTKLPSQNRDSWRKWWLSVDGVYGPRGTARLVYNIGEDRITDLCDVSPITVPTDLISPDPQNSELKNLPDIFKKPPPELSFLNYKCTAIVQSDSGNSLVRTMPQRAGDANDDQGIGANPFSITTLMRTGFRNIAGTLITGLFGGGGVRGGNGLIQPGQGRLENNQIPSGQGRLENNQSDSSAVRSKKTQWYVIIDGTAMRSYYPIPRPSIESINGFKVVPLDKENQGGFGQTQTHIMGVPIYAAKWRLKYGVEGDLGKANIDIPPHVLFPASGK
jgi:hypothetical protein